MSVRNGRSCPRLLPRRTTEVTWAAPAAAATRRRPCFIHMRQLACSEEVTGSCWEAEPQKALLGAWSACTCNFLATMQRDPQPKACEQGRFRPDQLATATSATDGTSLSHFWSASSCGPGKLRLLASVVSALLRLASSLAQRITFLLYSNHRDASLSCKQILVPDLYRPRSVCLRVATRGPRSALCL